MTGRFRRALERRLREHSGVNELERRVGDRIERAQRERDAARAEATQRADELARRVASLESLARIPVLMEVARRATLEREPLISVILPTRDRAGILARAIETVRAQSYGAWELIVVDDGSGDETPALLAGLDDDRVRSLRLEGRGVTAARNAGLTEARGELIAYLDDDNLMHEGWLRTVAWAFELRPEATVVYGAFVLDDPARVDGGPGGDEPEVVFRPFDRGRLAEENPADISAVAHRAGLDEARFDEDLAMYGDWELLARLTRDRDPFAVPAIACFYGTAAVSRLSAAPVDPAERTAVIRAVTGSDAVSE
jgi:hypothetical protein